MLHALYVLYEESLFIPKYENRLDLMVISKRFLDFGITHRVVGTWSNGEKSGVYVCIFCSIRACPFAVYRRFSSRLMRSVRTSDR